MLKSVSKLFKNLGFRFNEPYYSSTRSLRGFIYSFCTAIIVYVLLSVFEPFGLKNISNNNAIMLNCGLIALLGMLVAEFVLPMLIPNFYSEEGWKLSKQIFQLFLMVALVVGSVSYYLDTYTSADINFGYVTILALLYSIIPILTFGLFQQNLHKNKYRQKAEELNKVLQSQPVIGTETNVKILHFKGTRQSLNLIPNQLIYVKISANNSDFYYQQTMGIEKTTLEIEEKTVRKEFTSLSQFVAFHDDIILNANAIQKISGNAGGFELGIARINEHFKVSNKYKKNFDKFN